MGDYRELLFYQKARQVVQEIGSLIKSMPQTFQSQTIARQLLRSSTSVGANIAEGHGRHEGNEYIHYLIIARASANETDHWLYTVLDFGLESKEKIQPIIETNNEIRRMISATINTLKNKRNGREAHEGRPAYDILESTTLDD